MSYIGQGLPADTFQGYTTDSFTGDGSATTFTLSKQPFSENSLIVVINNVIQKPTTNFTVSGTTLTIVGTAVASGDVIYAIHTGGVLPIGEANRVDLNGASDQLILDADADTTISADTDDQIDFKAGNADTMHIFNGDVRINTTAAIQPGSSGGLGVKGDINISDFTNDTSSSALVFTKSRNTTPGSQTIVNNDDQVGAIFFKADDGDASDYNNNVAAITVTVDAAPGTNDTPGRLAFFTTADGERANTERMRINSSGYVGINNTNPSATLEVHTNNNITAFETQPKVNQTYYAALFRNSSGNDVGQIESTASATTFATSSDYRLKENVDYTWDATTRLKQLKPVRFNWIVDDTNTLVDGFLAHEVSSIVPEAISGEKDGTEIRTKVVLDASGNQLARNVEESDWTAGKEDETFPSDSTWEASKVYPKHQAIDHSKLVPLMVKTIQELEARIKTLEDA
jgi:hypothetical protein